MVPSPSHLIINDIQKKLSIARKNKSKTKEQSEASKELASKDQMLSEGACKSESLVTLTKLYKP